MFRRSNSGSDNQAVSVPLGTVLMFAVVMMLMGILQVGYFPAENANTEAESHEQVMEDFSNLLETYYETSADGNPRTTTIHTGVNYPTQFTKPLQNPSVIRSGGAEPVIFNNLEASGEMLDGKNGESVSYKTKRIEFVPDYWEWKDAPTVGVEHGLIYTKHPEATLVHNSQTLVNGERINVVLVEGNIQKRQQNTVTKTVQAENTYNETVLRGTQSKNLELTIQTTVPEDTWRNILQVEKTEQGGNLESIQYIKKSEAQNEITLVFKKGVDYTLRISRIRIETNL